VGRDFLGGGQHIYYIFVSPQALPLLITHSPAEASGGGVGAKEQEEEEEEEDGLHDSCPSRSFERYLAVWVPVCIYIRIHTYVCIRIHTYVCMYVCMYIGILRYGCLPLLPP
jgi:hypothetical protein